MAMQLKCIDLSLTRGTWFSLNSDGLVIFMLYAFYMCTKPLFHGKGMKMN